MNKTNILVLCIFVILTSEHSFANQQSHDEHRIQQNELYSLDIKEPIAVVDVQNGENINIEVEVVNKGKEIIDVNRIVNKSCSCLSKGSIEPNKLAPGTTGRLSFEYSSTGNNVGHHLVKLAIITKNKKAILLDVPVKISKDITVSPPNLNYGEIISGRKILETVEVISTIPLDSKQIFFCPSSEVIEISMNEDRNSILNLANKNRMLYRYVLNIVILAKQEKGELKEHIDILIKNYKGRDRIFRVSLTGHIIPVLNVEPEFLFLGYITPAKNVHKEVVITNKENSGFEVISVNLPNNITYSYEIT